MTSIMHCQWVVTADARQWSDAGLVELMVRGDIAILG